MWDEERFKKITALTDGQFVLSDGSTMYAIVGSSENFDCPSGQPCSLKIYQDPRGWKYNCLCRFPPEPGDTLFIGEMKKMGSCLLPGEKIVWSNWSDTKIYTVRQITVEETNFIVDEEFIDDYFDDYLDDMLSSGENCLP